MQTLVRLIQRLAPKGGRILDVGCAQGTLGLMLAEQGYRVSLLDVRPINLEYARARHERGDVSYHAGTLGPDCPPEGDFDVVTCTEVIEHVPAPAKLIEQLMAKTRSGGALVMTTPNPDCISTPMRVPTYGSAAQRVIDEAEVNSLDGDAHRFLYTREELVTILRSAGMRLESDGFFLPFWLAGEWKTRHAHRLFYNLSRRAGRLGARPPTPLLPFDRYLCVSQWVVCRRPTGENA
jgi:2-polyprenyl-3-methyl-5-hydroxy-6-metoxy-1,4-benzoquinol methylase